MATVKEIVALMNEPSEEERSLVEKAYSFAQKAHAGHQRFSGEPYFDHLSETAKGLAQIGMGAQTIAAGLLHDSIEDARVSAEEVEREFGAEILFLVEGVTKLGHLKYRGLERHAESLRKLLVATSQDIRVLMIKLMDRLHNMRTLASVPKEKRTRIALETLEIYAPIAHRLGMGLVRRELEDLAFPYVHPEEHARTLALLKQKSKETKRHLERFHKALRKALIRAGLINFQTSYRLKGLYSLYLKLQRKDNDIDKIYDIAALRIIVPTIDDCYKALGVVHANWRPLPGKIKDYIAFKKPNGYQSLHTTVFTGDGGIMEVQIRTREMHQESEYGIASHIVYKSGQRGEQERRIGLEWLRYFIPSFIRGSSTATPKAARAAPSSTRPRKDEAPTAPQWVKQMADLEAEGFGQEFLQKVKADFFSHRVFVFTPKGDVVDLPIGASTIDFAYAIHSDIGSHLSGAKINGKLVSLDSELQNGDIVEVQTKSSAHPTKKWLDSVKTAFAQKSIRAAIAKNDSNSK